MQVILIQQSCEDVLKSEVLILENLTKLEAILIIIEAKSAIVLCVGDKLLMEITKEKTAKEIWVKFESLYMTKSLVHVLYLK